MVNLSPVDRPPTPDAVPPWRWSAWPLWQQGVAFVLAYPALAALSFFVEAQPSPMVTMWLPAGLYLSVLLRVEPRHWPLFVALAVPANLGFDLWTGKTVPFSLLLWAANSLEAVLGAWLVRRFATRNLQNPTERELLFAMLASPFVAGCAASALGSAATMGWDAFPRQWFGWWVGDAVGILLVTPLVLTAGELRLRREAYSPQTDRIARTAFAIVLAAWTIFVFRESWHPGVALKFTLLPFAMIAGARFGVTMASLTCLTVALAAAWFTTRGESDAGMAGLAPEATLIALQVFLIALTVPALFSAAFLATLQRAADARRAAHERLTAVLNGARDTILVADAGTGVILDANEAAARLFGRARQALIGVHHSELHPPSEAGVYATQFQAQARLGVPILREADIQTADGRIVPVEINACSVTIENGRRAVVGILRDLSEHKRADEHYRAILHASMDGFLLVDREGVILDVNPAVCDLSGYSRQELLNMPVKNLSAGGTPEAAAARRQRLLDLGQDRFEIGLRRKDGTERQVDVSSTFLADREVVFIFLRDITDRQRIERDLQYRSLLLDQITDAVTATDMDGTITYVNASQCRLQERTRDELVGANANIFGADPLRGATQERITDDTRTDGEWSGRVVNRSKTGEERIVELRTTVVRNDVGTPVAMVGVGTDVTKRTEAEAALAQSQAVLKAIYDHTPVMMCVLDDQSQVRYVNRSFEVFTGSSVEVLNPAAAGNVIRCIRASDDPRGCGFGKDCSGCVLRLALVDSLRTGASHSGIDYRATLCVNDGLRDVALLGSTTRIDTGRETLLLLCLIDVTREKQAEADLLASRDRLRAVTRRLVSLREEAGRELAAELHDRVGQNLTALNLNFARLQDGLAGIDDRRITGPLQDSFTIVAETMGHVRSVMSGLRPPVLEDYGLAAAVRWYAGQFARRTGLTISVRADDVDKISAQTDATLFRIVQEALNNVARHASARSVLVTLTSHDGALSLEVTDDGAGFDEAAPFDPGCTGLVTMRERAEDIGGHCAVMSTRGRGTTVKIDVPAAVAGRRAPRGGR